MSDSMSELGPDWPDRTELRDRLANPDAYMVQTYGQDFLNDFADIYKRSGRINKLRRWVMEKTFPQEVTDYTLLVITQQSVAQARKSAPTKEGHTIIV